MKKLNLWFFASLFVAAFALTACSSSDSSSDGPGGAPQPTYNGNPDNPRYAALYGVRGE
jgi:ABC-type oligopeptide transport system substrate-binding subunit